MRGTLVLGAVCGSVLLCGIANDASGNELTTYTYDAKGRVILVERSGNVNDGVVTNYNYDAADNRRRVKVTGSPNPPPS